MKNVYFCLKRLLVSLLAITLFACTESDSVLPELPEEENVSGEENGDNDESGESVGDVENGEDDSNDGNKDDGESGGNVDNDDENYTPEIPIGENGYDGLLATDKALDVVVSGSDAYWENTEFGSTVTIVYSKSSAEVTTSNSAIRSYVTGADVALDLTDCGAVEVIASGATEEGQLKIYGNSAVKLTLNGAYIKSNKSAAINVQNKSTLYLHLADGTENYIWMRHHKVMSRIIPKGLQPLTRSAMVHSTAKALWLSAVAVCSCWMARRNTAYRSKGLQQSERVLRLP